MATTRTKNLKDRNLKEVHSAILEKYRGRN